MRDLPHPATIKTSAPSLAGVIERPRLVSALAQLSADAKWLQSPSGTGKSTLAASYARSGSKRLAWYRLDERDNDPAFFYEEFAHTVSAQLRLTDALPKFAADDHDRQQSFAQRFFTSLVEQIDESALIVFDDMHRLTAASMLSSLTELIGLAGERIELLFVSQATAPIAFFDAIAARQLGLLNDADLRFDADECKAMTAALRIDGAQCEHIAALTGGHAGALVLACELLRGTDARSALGVETVERIHSHLLSKLIDRMPQMRRDLLMQTAFVTQLTRLIAQELSGTEASTQVDALVESGLLLRSGEDATEAFEAHGLVRHGMQALVRARLGAAEARTLAERTATTLVANGQREAAFAVLVEVGSTLRAIDVMRQLAEHYAENGQSDLLMSSIGKLPPAAVKGNAWLCFWTGQALLRIDEEQARIWFESSFSAFEVANDSLGKRLAAASMVTAFQLECGDLRDLDAWILLHRNAGGDTPIPTGDRFEATLIMGVICAAFVCATYPPQIDPASLIARLRSLIDSPSAWLSDDQRVQAARLLVEHCRIFAKLEQGQNVIVATRFLIDDAIGGALHRGRWLIIAAYSHAVGGDAVGAARYLDEARTLAERSASTRLSFELGLAFADHWMKAQDLEHAATELCLLEKITRKAPPAQRAEYAKMMTRLLLLQGHHAEGLRWAEEAMRIATPAGFTGANLRAYEIELVYARAANSRFQEAVELVSRQDIEPREARLAIEHCLRFLLEDGCDLPSLRDGLRYAAQIGFVNLLDRAREPLARICEAALANGIEAEFVLRVIKLKQLKPPPLTGPHWPWAVHIRTLGGFRLDIQGERYRPTHKAQDKPLELLKLLVTCQALSRSSAEKIWLAERLWTDAPAENARKSLDMTIARLRSLLRDENAIVANEGRLQLSADRVWSDITPLQHAMSHARLLRDARAAGKPIVMAEVASSVATVLELYAGPYMAEEEGPPWLLAGREAIVTAVRQALTTAEVILDGSADDLLVPALQKALAADPASEDLARSLMRALIRQGRNSEALQVYRRLRQMLSVLLAIAPSPETDHIRDQAYATEPR